MFELFSEAMLKFRVSVLTRLILNLQYLFKKVLVPISLDRHEYYNKYNYILHQ